MDQIYAQDVDRVINILERIATALEKLCEPPSSEEPTDGRWPERPRAEQR